MHYAYPPRKASHPPPYAPRSSRNIAGLRRNRTKLLAITGLFFIAVIWLLTRPSSSHAAPSPHKPSGNPPVVIVTAVDEATYDKDYLDTIKENRIKYAEKHGYKTFFPKVSDYDLKNAPKSWTKVVAMRHALTKFPDAYFFWYLDQNAFIMNPRLKIEDHITKNSRLEELMKKDHPVVPPDSIIKTFSHLKGQDVDFVLTQDSEGLSAGSFIVRNGEWARFFLETWFDPIYRSYNFQKAETHALEHIIQWHPTILARMAIIDQRLLNSYSQHNKGDEYRDGDLAVRFVDCLAAGVQACQTESQKFTQKWRTAFSSS
ncbi:family 34 putative glycosyltransferase [Podospora fimiseda]|uniref:Family 34 putative glycosyltransferase n=1 Tax=Podospora fimiseda TaxID=252190 RepID=A0AAN7BR81_9PEZI|nr:family 34 putative glycosyltransferase [Podospora fimiseda]